MYSRRQRADAVSASMSSIAFLSISSVASPWSELEVVLPVPASTKISGAYGNVSVIVYVCDDDASAITVTLLGLAFVVKVFPVVVADVEERSLGLIVSPSNIFMKPQIHFSRRSKMSSGSGYSNVAA